MQATKKTKAITPEWILERISEFQIYKMYIPKFTLNRKIKSPMRSGDDSPSFSIFVKGSHIYFKDYGAVQYRGGPFDLVMQKFGISYPDALQKVAEDAGLVESVGKIVEQLEWEQPELIEEEVIIQAKAWGKWRKEHYNYLEAYSLTPDDLNFCSDTKCLPLKEYAVNGLRMPLDEKEMGFIYHLKNERGSWVKIYRPTKSKKDRWRSNVPFVEMMGIDNMKGCETGIITKSIKDASLLHKYITPSVSIVQGEDFSAISPQNMELLNSYCKKIYVSFDNDQKGVDACKEITQATGWGYINPPNRLKDKGITDWADWVKATDVQTIVDFFRKKEVII